MTRPRITIGMPVYNGEGYVEAAIRSLLDQTEGDFQLLIVDDGSTDRSPEICERLQHEDERVRFDRHASNEGMTATFLQLLGSASGGLFMWAGQDDTWDPDFLSEGSHLLDGDPGAIAYMPGMRLEDREGREITTFPPPRGLASHDPLTRAKAVHRGGYHAIYALYRRHALPPDVLLADVSGTDCAFVFEMALRGRFVLSEAVRSFRRGIGYNLVPGPDDRMVNKKALGPSGHLYSRNPNAMSALMVRSALSTSLPPADKGKLIAHVALWWWARRWRWLMLSDSTYRVRRKVQRHAYVGAGLLFARAALLSPRSAWRTIRALRDDLGSRP